MNDVEELERAFAYPWDKWTIFLHPAQRDWVTQDFSGPARVSGSAGTGKTIVALHRAAHLARTNPNARVWLGTFSPTLARALHHKLKLLLSSELLLGERIEVYAVDTMAERLYEAHFGPRQQPTREQIESLLTDAATAHSQTPFSASFLSAEWRHVVDAWQLESWADYRDVRRTGRRTRLPESQRAALWPIFEQVRAQLEEQDLVTQATMYRRLTEALATRKHPPFDFVVIDEAQDISVPQLRFLAGIGSTHPDALFFAGDLGQRIFQQPFSWKSLGVDIRGRARTLQVNYRTSHQIRRQADRLLAAEVGDVDGHTERRDGTVSVFNGPEPDVRRFADAASESAAVGQWLAERIDEGVLAQELGVFVRSPAELDRACDAVKSAGLSFAVLDDATQSAPGEVSISAMHRAKGLEFRAVAVMACDDEVVPLQARLEDVADDAELEEIYDTERHLLYVACTRARDRLMVSGVKPVSEFLDDLVARH